MGSTTAVYHRDANHLWNRLHRQLFIRVDTQRRIAESIQASPGRERFAGTTIPSVFGLDDVDPLLWPPSQHLLLGQSHQQAVDILDEFIRNDGAKQFADPMRRAVMQNDLWSVFDWTDHPHTRESKMRSLRSPKLHAARSSLRMRLANAIASLALSDQEIESLTDNYQSAVATKKAPAQFSSMHSESAYLPTDLMNPVGSWICIAGNVGDEPTALTHAQFFSGRSYFLVFIRLPGGRAATKAYLKQLNLFPKPWAVRPNPVRRATVGPHKGELRRNDVLQISNELPQFPIGTEVAFVRRMMVIDKKGQIRSTPITQSVQIRNYRRVGELPGADRKSAQVAFEWQLSRQRLFAKVAGGLHADGHSLPALQTLQFLTGWSDPFENDELAKHLRPRGDTCSACHPGGTIRSVNTFARAALRSQQKGPALIESSVETQQRRTIDWKAKQHDWGLLQGLWEAKPSQSLQRSTSRAEVSNNGR